MSRIAGIIRSPELLYWQVRARLQFAIRRVRWPKGLVVKGPLGLCAEGNVLIGDNVSIVNDSKFNRAGINHPTQLVAGKGATLNIGNNVGISGAAIYAMELITIGDHALIGVNAAIYDTDFHPVDYWSRRQSGPPKTAPVNIEDDVWIGANAVVLKGVTVGARSVIGACSLVCDNVAPDAVAGGVPAKVINRLVTGKNKLG